MLNCFGNGAKMSFFFIIGDSSGMLPSYSRPINPTATNRNRHASASTIAHQYLPKQQAVRTPPDRFHLSKPVSSSWSAYKATTLNVSNIISHQTTPLFGLWQGYNSHSSSFDEKLHMNLKQFNETGNLFLPGQNKTEIIAHIGTTVVMDCKIATPDLDEYAPVSFNMS